MELTPLENWISQKTGIQGPPVSAHLREYQLNMLRETLMLVSEKSRFYKKRLKGISPEVIVDMAAVSRLPFTYPADLEACPTDFLCVSARDIDRIVTLSTSGTTGHPKRLYFTEKDQELTVDFFHHGMTTMADGSDKVMIFMPGSTDGSVGDLLQKGLIRFNCQSIVYGPIRDYAHALAALIRENITCIVGIPSQILTLSRYKSHSAEAAQLQIRSVLLSADYVPKAVSGWLGEVWGTAVYGHYGMTEMGLGGGVECSAHQGYHMRDADLLFEIIDPLIGQPVPDGTYGEIVFSTLTRSGMPLIRYRTGDRSRFLTEPCRCGSVLRRLDHVSGRISEAVILPDEQTLSITQLDEVILSDPSVTAFQAEISEIGGCDCLTITIENNNENFDRDGLTRRIRPILGDRLDEGKMKIDIKCGDNAFFTTGTLKRCIIDKRNTKGKKGHYEGNI